MSKFYSKYCENYKSYKPIWLEEEEQANRRHKMHIMQAKMTTFGNHTGRLIKIRKLLLIDFK